jgi:hypothetical protein
MCEPTTIVMGTMAVLSAAGSMMSIHGKNEATEARAESAYQSMERQYEQLRRQREQVTEQANLEKMEARRQALRKQGKLRAAFGEANVLGNSTLRQLHDAMMQAEYDIGLIESNRQRAIKGAQYEKQMVQETAKSRMKLAEASTIGPLQGSFKIGTSAAQGAMSGYQMGGQLKGVLNSGGSVSSMPTQPAPYGIGPQTAGAVG